MGRFRLSCLRGGIHLAADPYLCQHLVLVKTLYLVRHAKSSWRAGVGNDHDRPLNKRGYRDAPAMAERLRARGVRIDRLIASSAKRAQETASFFSDSLELNDQQVVVESTLYGASAADWLSLVQQLDESWQSVMMIGHNPTLTELANGLGRMDIMNVPTCGVLECRFAGEYWAGFGDRRDELEIGFDFPKNVSV